MYVNVAVLKETQVHERRVALVPVLIEKLTKLGARLHMQSGAGDASGLDDAVFDDVVIMTDRTAMVGAADVVLAVQAPAVAVVDAMQEGAILICFVDPAHDAVLLERLLARRITCFAMASIPRVTRAQAMDALSSQAALAGYYAVLLGATHLPRVLPKVTTAGGTIGPAKVLVMGLGVAGLEAVATAHRLGAMVEGYDVRPDTAGQIASLGANFVATGGDATGKGGYARALTPAETTKIETYNEFMDWICFGGPVVKSGAPVEQEKQLKYASLVANAVMLSNVVDLSDVLSVMAKEGQPVSAALAARISPYIRDHIRRLGRFALGACRT
jgi:NAD(P) transhydrogenase subunit alpha